MPIFLLLLTKLIPLYATVGLGFLAGKKLKVQAESVSAIVFYLLVPVIMFSGVVKIELSAATLALPLLSYILSATLTLAYYRIARLAYKDANANILACAAGTGNTGYFGLPVAMALFDEQTVAAYIMLVLGVTLAESSVGYFLAARGHAHWQDALRKTLRLPSLYAFLVGLLVQVLHLPLPEMVWDFISNIRGTYTVLGMMIVGLGIANLKRLELDWRFLSVAFSAKFLAWPALALLFTRLDASVFGLYDAEIHRALLLLSIVPMAANSVMIATLLRISPGKVASAVLLSTALGAGFVPMMIALFIA